MMMTRREQIAEILNEGWTSHCSHKPCPYEGQQTCSCKTCTLDRILSIGLETCPHRGHDHSEKNWWWCITFQMWCGPLTTADCGALKRINAAIKGEG